MEPVFVIWRVPYLTEKYWPQNFESTNVRESDAIAKTAEQLGTGIAENRRVLVEGGLHVVTSARSGTIDVVLDGLGDRVTLAHVSRYITHGS